MKTADLLLRPDLTLPVPKQPVNGADELAVHTRKVIDEIVNNVVTEIGREIGSLRKELDDFDRILMVQASKTKNSMEAYVELVRAGHALTDHVHQRLQNMRTNEVFREE